MYPPLCQKPHFIIIDSAMDNPVVVREVLKLKKDVAKKKNVFIVEIVSFEYVLLSFKYLEK